MILTKAIQLPLTPFKALIGYIPKGPLLNWTDLDCREETIDSIQETAKEKHYIYIKIDPDVVLGSGIPGTDQERQEKTGIDVCENLSKRGWRYSNDQIQFKNTVVLDLSQSEDEIMSRMKQKNRYNIRLAERKGITIDDADPEDFSLLYKMYAATSIRDNFVIRSEQYYQRVWKIFLEHNMAKFLVAYFDHKPIAALFLVYFGQTAWYFYGMSLSEYREKMPNHLLQWHAILEAKKQNCLRYDLWGAPDIFDASDPMWGVYRFKEGFNGNVIRTIGAWDYPVYPQLYTFYTNLMPRIMNYFRKRGIAQTKRTLAGMS